MSGRVPPSSRASARSTGRSDTQRAGTRYKRFTGHDPEEVSRVELPPLPKAAAVIGDVTAICYRTVRDGREEDYIHEFSAHAQPLLCVTPDGKQILLIGGRYTFTERGIVDKRRR